MHDAQQDKGRGTLLRLLAVYLLWSAAGVLGGSFVFLFYKDAGATLTELVSSFFFWAAAAVLVVHLLEGRRLDLRAVLVFGVAVQVAAYMLVAFSTPSAFILYLYSFLLGMNSFLFWVSFNIMYFELSKGREAMLSSVYFAANPLFGIFFPLIGGVLTSAYSFNLVFILAAAIYTLIFPFAFLTLGQRQFFYQLKDCIRGLKGFKTLILLEGTYSGGLIAALTVIPLLYFTKPAELGAYISVTTLFSVLASLTVSRLSDKSRKRKKYISLFGSGLGITTAIMSFANTAFLWSATISVRNFFATLFYPFTITIIMDNQRKSVEGVMVGREWLLNYGRLFGIAIVFAATILNNIHLSLAFLGLIIITYPLVIELKRHHIRVE